MSQAETPGSADEQASKRREPRESVWSVRRKHADTFFATLFTMWIAIATAVTMLYLNDQSRPEGQQIAEFVVRTAVDILVKLGAATIPVVMTSMILTKPLTIVGGAIVITFEAMKARWVTPVIKKHQERGRAEGIAQGITQGEAQGIAQGEAQANEQWSDWWRRRQEAEANGLPFDEPPPSDS